MLNIFQENQKGFSNLILLSAFFVVAVGLGVYGYIAFSGQSQDVSKTKDGNNVTSKKTTSTFSSSESVGSEVENQKAATSDAVKEVDVATSAKEVLPDSPQESVPNPIDSSYKNPFK
ncbi:MAG: hypothetical protein ABEI53_02850 [Candidatus Magasanikbacteria bacterium]